MTKETTIDGLHHVTAIAGDAQRNLDFYTGPMAQHLVKLTVNFDDPSVYHFYFGDRAGQPGTIMTFFPFPAARRARPGVGTTSAVAWGLPDPAAAAATLARAGLVLHEGERFGAPLWSLEDPDGLPLELTTGEGGFHSVTLWLDDPEPTARLLTGVFGYIPQDEAHEDGGTRLRLALPGAGMGRVIDLWRADRPVHAQGGAGSIHHIAFRARDRAHQAALTEAVRASGLGVTPVQDRNYFESVYFREPGGVLFEIATDPPGFAIDEPADALGRTLKLPERYEPVRDRIKAVLPPLTLPRG